MRDLLNWTTEDIIYFRKNFQIRNPDEPRVNYTEVQKSEARKWNWADNLLYSHFKKKLDAKLDQNPSYYKQEVDKLHSRSRQWMDHCVKNVIPSNLVNNGYLNAGYPPSVGAYMLTPQGRLDDRCIQLTITEVAKVRLLNEGNPINAEVFKRADIN